jgi:hypothetical protein
LITLVNEMQTAGLKETRLNGAHLASGIYFCRLRAAGREQTIQIVKS